MKFVFTHLKKIIVRIDDKRHLYVISIIFKNPFNVCNLCFFKFCMVQVFIMYYTYYKILWLHPFCKYQISILRFPVRDCYVAIQPSVVHSFSMFMVKLLFCVVNVIFMHNKVYFIHSLNFLQRFNEVKTEVITKKVVNAFKNLDSR